MQWRRYLWHLLFLTLTWLSGAQSALAEEVLRVGVAEADITPPQGFLVAGYYHERRATGEAIGATGEVMNPSIPQVN
jgi:hypothetical protein